MNRESDFGQRRYEKMYLYHKVSRLNHEREKKLKPLRTPRTWDQIKKYIDYYYLNRDDVESGLVKAVRYVRKHTNLSLKEAIYAVRGDIKMTNAILLQKELEKL